MKPLSFTRSMLIQGFTRSMLIQASFVLLAIACYAYGSMHQSNRIIKAIGTYGIFGFSMSMWFTMAMWARPKERDRHGNPMVRYCGPRFSIPLCALLFGAVGFVELINPVNHRYSENLFILAYTPLSVAVITIFLSIYFWTYRVTMKGDVIEREMWPLLSKSYELKDLLSIEDNRPRNAILIFSNGRQIKLNGLLSGLANFVDNVQSLPNTH